MSKVEKALARLKNRPKDFTWRELQFIMSHFGYEEMKSDGSRRKFISRDTKISVSLHEPRPKPIMKRYAIDIVIEHLTEEGFL
jgi:hypothetical protein